MNDHNSYLVILNTCPNKETATEVANTLIQRRLAACVNILPGLTSVYHWQGQIESEEEILLLIKSTQAAFDVVKDTICEIHPYELPEIVAVPLVGGLDTYLSWIDANVQSQRTITDA